MKRILALILIAFFTTSVFASTPLVKQPAVQTYIKEMVKQHHFDKAKLEKLFAQVKIDQTVLKKIKSPYEAKPWYQYKRLFLSQKVINHGVKFWQENKKTLDRAEKQFGVPADIIVSIIGTETRFGKHTGNFNAIDALSTLAFAYPPRQKFFKKELTSFLILARDQHWNPLTVKSSYAGALGLPQFMPSSYIHYAVDFNNNGKKNLLSSNADVIGSIANYLKKNGWKKGKTIAAPATISGKRYSKLADKGLKPTLRLNQLAKDGIKVAKPVDNNPKAALLSFYNSKTSKQYWLTFNNFYTITRYNKSKKYAMVVYQLAQDIQNQFNT